LPFREFKPLENHALLLKTYQGASTNISSLGLAVTEMHNAKVEKDILLSKQNTWLSCIQFQVFQFLYQHDVLWDQELNDCLAEILFLFSENDLNPNYISE